MLSDFGVGVLVWIWFGGEGLRALLVIACGWIWMLVVVECW